MKQAHVFISGSVQGVGYRYFVQSNASKLGLVGWVRNTEDGGVEAVFNGEENIVMQMIELCKTGSSLAVVKHIGFEWEDEETFTDFQIL